MKLEEIMPELRAGHKVTNMNWTPGMFIVLQAGYPEGIPINQNTADSLGLPLGTIKRFRPYVMLNTVDDSFVPYVMTQSDMLSEVWEVIGQATPANPFVIGYNFEDPQPTISVDELEPPFK